MIVKIQPPGTNVKAAVEYNERKMDGVEGIRDHKDESLHGIEDGHVLATRNVPDGKTLSGLMEEYQMESIKKKRSGPITRNVAFHMSINPSETDRVLSDKEAVKFADEIMKALGYGKQPYRIYKHTDIEREHYHVVSCRVDENGKKIKDNFERLVLRETLKKLADKYGYTLVLTEEEEQKEGRKEIRQEEKKKADEKKAAETTEKKTTAGNAADDDKDSIAATPGFTRATKEPVISQIERLCREGLRWHFSTFQQYQALMLRRFNLMVEIEKTSEERVVALGTDGKGNTITPPVPEQSFGLSLAAILKERMRKEKMHNRREQRAHVEKLARAAAEASESYGEFVETMKLKGVYVVLSWTSAGEPFGITYLDRSTRCAWKGSETQVDMKWFKETASAKGWKPEKDRLQKVIDMRNNTPSRTPEFTQTTTVPRKKVSGSKGGDRPLRPVWRGGAGKDNPQGPVRDANRHSNDSVLNRKGGYNPYDDVEKQKDKPVELIK